MIRMFTYQLIRPGEKKIVGPTAKFQYRYRVGEFPISDTLPTTRNIASIPTRGFVTLPTISRHEISLHLPTVYRSYKTKFLIAENELYA